MMLRESAPQSFYAVAMTIACTQQRCKSDTSHNCRNLVPPTRPGCVAISAVWRD